MKIVAFILTVYILMLTFAPVLELSEMVSNASNCSTTCCASDAPVEEHENDEENCDELCNPFLTCSSCIGFTATSLVSIQQNQHSINTRIIAFIQSPYLKHIDSIWHPPKQG